MRRTLRLRKKWKDPWFLSLTPIGKLVIEYVSCHCNAAGVFEFDRTEMELRIGFGRIDPVWIHPQIRGIEFLTQELAQEDAEARGLVPAKVRAKELVRWSQIVSAINKRPSEFKGEIVPQIEIIGEGRWWLVRFIEHEFGNAAYGEKATLRLNEGNIRHRVAIQCLREHALLERFKQYYPDATIIESANPKKAISAIAPEIDAKIPTMADVLNAPEGGRLPPTERKIFWMFHNDRHWENAEDWRKLLGAEEIAWAIKFDYSQITGNSWPETKRERQNALESIETHIAEESANRIEIDGQKRLAPDAMERIKKLSRAKELIENMPAK